MRIEICITLWLSQSLFFRVVFPQSSLLCTMFTTRDTGYYTLCPSDNITTWQQTNIIRQNLRIIPEFYLDLTVKFRARVVCGSRRFSSNPWCVSRPHFCGRSHCSKIASTYPKSPKRAKRQQFPVRMTPAVSLHSWSGVPDVCYQLQQRSQIV